MPLEKAGAADSLQKEYFGKLEARKLESHVHRRYQLLGLQIADLLGDRTHKALYIKLVKERGSEELLGLAKRISSLPQVERKGAYFMACLPKLKKQKAKVKVKESRSRGTP